MIALLLLHLVQAADDALNATDQSTTNSTTEDTGCKSCTFCCVDGECGGEDECEQKLTLTLLVSVSLVLAGLLLFVYFQTRGNNECCDIDCLRRTFKMQDIENKHRIGPLQIFEGAAEGNEHRETRDSKQHEMTVKHSLTPLGADDEIASHRRLVPSTPSRMHQEDV
jgi:hypothetical protein